MITTIQVHISEQRTHILTPKRKRLGKAVARKSNKSIAEECMKSQEVRKYVIIQLGVLLRHELKNLCSDSTNSLLRSNLGNSMFFVLIIIIITTNADSRYPFGSKRRHLEYIYIYNYIYIMYM